MDEKRRSKRLPVNIKLSISDLFSQDNKGIHNIDSPIEVVDISQHGIGFVSECVLPTGYFFNTRIQLGKETSEIFTVVKIIRSEALSKDEYKYGAIFSGISPEFTEIIKKYSENYKKEQ